MLTAKCFKLSQNNFHSSMLAFHSQKKPNLSITTNNTNIKIKMGEETLEGLQSRGNKSTNSTSKTKKIKVTRKKCREKEERLFLVGRNPHSKGLSLTLSIIGDLLRILEIKIKAKHRSQIEQKSLINIII